MSRKTFFVPLSVALAGATVAFGADPVFTDPVGYVKLGNTTGETDAVSADTDVHLSIPLERELEFSGTVASTNGASSTITVSASPGWADDVWVSGDPHTAVISSGDENGLRGLISANDDDTLTLMLSTPGDISLIQAGDSIQIRKSWTLTSFFSGADIADNSEVLVFAPAAGTNHGSSDNYLYFGGVWYDSNFNVIGVDVPEVVLHPSELFIFRSGSQAVPILTIFGDVPNARQRVDLTKIGNGAEDIEMGLSSPVPQVVGDLGLPAGDNDEILIFDPFAGGTNKGSSKNLINFGGVWYDENFDDVTNSYTLQPGTGFILRRSAGDSGDPVEWNHGYGN